MCPYYGTLSLWGLRTSTTLESMGRNLFLIALLTINHRESKLGTMWTGYWVTQKSEGAAQVIERIISLVGLLGPGPLLIGCAVYTKQYVHHHNHPFINDRYCETGYRKIACLIQAKIISKPVSKLCKNNLLTPMS